jgi:nucleoside-triphosphatase
MDNIRLLVRKGARVRKRLLFLTGCPGVGKTTVLLKTVEFLEAGGWTVGGMISREVRERGERVGFEISDLCSGRLGWLAHVSQQSGPRIGKYRVNLADLEGVGVSAISEAVERSDVVVVDEIGPMELFSERFRQAVKRVVDCERLVICVIHWKARDRLLEEIGAREDAQIYVVTLENRGGLPATVASGAEAFLKQARIR